jgi:adenosylhomocysteine nucleosidase
MPIEAQYFAAQLDNATVEHVANFAYHLGELGGYPVCVCKTAKGMENTAASTAVAMERYEPIAIINQGTSGGHDPSLHVGDIVLGKRVLNIGMFDAIVYGYERLPSANCKLIRREPQDAHASIGRGQ